MSTVAPGTIAPDGSVMVPLKPPEVLCAPADVAVIISAMPTPETIEFGGR